LKENKNISAPKVGMNRDTHPSLLKNTDYTFALNANTENQTGDKVNITNEPSNRLSVFFSDYKVILQQKDITSDRTYYFLTNPTTRKSSIGYVNDVKYVINNFDEPIDCGDCESVANTLDTPLEEQTQYPLHEYIELVNDNCLVDDGETGFNFDINFPIKSPEIKVEKTGTVIYFNDYKNPPRWIRVSDVSYLFIEEVPCGDDIITECPIVSKLLQFPEHTKIQLEVDTLQTGGNLKLGVYEYYAAYCDVEGSEITNYSTPTNPTSIFDENNVVLAQTELDSFTNFSIRLKANNLDKTFQYYKVVCVEKSNVNKTESAYIVGIYPTTDNTVLHTSSQTTNDDTISNGNSVIRRAVEMSVLTKVRPPFSKAKGDVAIEGKKFMWGISKKPEINLQPVVNLFSSLIKWQSSIAKEDLYKSAVATARYKGFARDEVQPLSIRFYNKDGSYSANFPMVARPALDTDLEEVDSENDNRVSLEATTPNCTKKSRNQRWKIFNTASAEDGYCSDLENGVEVEEYTERSCIVEDVAVVSQDTIILTLEAEFTDLRSYINDNFDEVTNPTSDSYIPELALYLLNTYPDDHCSDVEDLFGDTCTTPAFESSTTQISEISTELTIGDSLEVGREYIIDVLEAGDDFSNVGYIQEGQYFIATGTTPTTWLTTVVNVQEKQFIESLFPDDYIRVRPPSFCNLYRLGTSGTPVVNTTFVANYMPCGETAFIRNFDFENTECSYAEEVQNITSTNDSVQGYFHNYTGASSVAGLLTTLDSDAISSGWNNKIHVGALWFKVQTLNRTKFILELSKILDPADDDDIANGQVVRLTFYNKCTSTTNFHSALVNLATGGMLMFEKVAGDLLVTNEAGTTTNLGTVTGNSFFVAVDCKIVDASAKFYVPPTPPDEDPTCFDSMTLARTAPPDGCFSIVTRDIENKYVEVSWTSLSIDKVETYSSKCTYFIPKVQDCEPQAYKKGDFAFWQSTENYPDNEELYNSSNLVINEEDLALLQAKDKLKFKSYFVEGTDINGNYIYKVNVDTDKPLTNLVCEPIRHFKFPDNKVSPFMSDTNGASFSDGIIFPLGIEVDSNIVSTMLLVAKNNNLITQEEFDNIAGYEIMKGDNSFAKSVIASGLGYDMYQYNQGNNKVLYANYPHNDLGDDLLHLTSSSSSTLIPHPFAGQKNNRFTFLSPDLAFNKIAIPNEVVLTGYQLGKSKAIFPNVDEHPKWTILGQKARRTAEFLAVTEVALEIAIGVANIRKEIGGWFFGGPAGAGSDAPSVAVKYTTLGIFLISALYGAVVNKGRYRYEWLKVFEDLGAAYNFANYGISTGHHNNFLVAQDEDNYTRGISVKKHLLSGDFTFRDENDGATGKPIFVNNFLRERSTFLSLGDHYFNYDLSYINYDNNKIAPQVGSRTILSQNNCDGTAESVRNVGSPYFTLKNYIPDQFGTIDSIKWLTMGHYQELDTDTTCKTIFGGNVCISRYSELRKVPIFRKNVVGTADKVPFNYSDYRNIGYPKYYCNYKSDTEYNFAGIPFPDIDSHYNFDCLSSRNRFYIKPPAKMYLFYYGITSFLVESEINCNFRYAGKQLKENFYPQAGDVINWTQESKIPIAENRDFKYNKLYSSVVSNTPFRKLDTTYSKIDWALRDNQENALVCSEPDNSENNYSDPWLIYKPLNWYEFPTKYGKLIDLIALERSEILARFENQQVVFNAVDKLADRLTPSNKNLGLAGMFATRPTELKTTDLGFAGTQNTESLSTPFGRVTVDAKRGQIFLQTGDNLEVISERNGNNLSGMTNWFREHLPFKILKYVQNVDIDNKYKGIGISLGYDNRFSRLFVTKRDYILKQPISYDEEIGFYIEEDDVRTPIYYDNSDFFEDMSWTISYKLSEGMWSSYHSLNPDYYSSHNDYFQTGFNWGEDSGTLWSHNLDNSSFQVFNGRVYPFTVEFPIINENANKFLNNIALNVEAKRWQNEWDYSQWKGVGFNKAVIYNNTQNSGVLNLVEQKTISDVRNYPMTSPDRLEQAILYTPKEGKHHFNYFYNRVRNQDVNVPIWLWDKNMINKTINTNVVNFKNHKQVLEKLRGEWFLVRLTNDEKTAFGITLKNTVNTETIY